MSDLLANPSFKIAEALEKKLRNLEKRRSKLQQIKTELDNGMKLTDVQLEAISKTGEVELQIEYVKEMNKLVQQQQKQYLRAKKLNQESQDKANREAEANNVMHCLQYHEALKILSRKDLKASFENSGLNLSTEDLDSLEKVGYEINSSVDQFDDVEEWKGQTKHVAQLLQDIYLGHQSVVTAGFTGARLKEIINGLTGSELFKGLQFTARNKEINVDECNTDESSLNDFKQESADENVVKTPQNEIVVENIDVASNPAETPDNSPQIISNGSVDESFVVVNVPQTETIGTELAVSIENGESNSLNEDVNHVANDVNENNVKNDINLSNGDQSVLHNDSIELNVVVGNTVDAPNDGGAPLVNGVPPRNVNGYRRNGNYRQHQNGNFRRGPQQQGGNKSNFKNGYRNGRSRFNGQSGDEENQAPERQRDSSKSGSVSGDNGFVRAGNSKRRNYETNTGNNYNRNHRRRDSPPDAVNNDVQNSPVNEPQDQATARPRVNRTKSNNFNGSHGRNSFGNDSEERKPRYRQNYECGFRFAV